MRRRRALWHAAPTAAAGWRAATPLYRFADDASRVFLFGCRLTLWPSQNDAALALDAALQGPLHVDVGRRAQKCRTLAASTKTKLATSQQVRRCDAASAGRQRRRRAQAALDDAAASEELLTQLQRAAARRQAACEKQIERAMAQWVGAVLVPLVVEQRSAMLHECLELVRSTTRSRHSCSSRRVLVVTERARRRSQCLARRRRAQARDDDARLWRRRGRRRRARDDDHRAHGGRARRQDALVSRLGRRLDRWDDADVVGGC